MNPIHPAGQASAGAPIRAIALETYELTKRFGAFVALDQVSMLVKPGTVHALLGETVPASQPW